VPIQPLVGHKHENFVLEQSCFIVDLTEKEVDFAFIYIQYQYITVVEI